MPPHPHGAARTSRLPRSKAKSTLHASNPIICYLQGQGPGWKPCPPLHPSSTKDHRAMWSLLWHGARRGQGPSWGSAQHPDPQDEVLKPLWHREAPISRTTAVSPGGWRAAAQGQASWGYLPTSQQHPPAVKHQSHPGHLAPMIFPSANKLLTPAILWANCSSCKLMGRASTRQAQLHSPLKYLFRSTLALPQLTTTPGCTMGNLCRNIFPTTPSKSYTQACNANRLRGIIEGL